MGTVMKAIQVHKFGTSSVLKLATNVPKPSIKGNQILINVKCSGINPVDTYIRSGVYSKLPDLPYIPGKDGAGVVVEVGPAVKKFKVGSRVMMTQNGQYGSLAEYMLVDENFAFPLPDDISFEKGASIPIPYFTAYKALCILGKSKPGCRVLVHGASGGVGQAAVQLATGAGMVVSGTAGSTEGFEVVRQCGAAEVYDHSTSGYLDHLKEDENVKFDVILEMLANENLDIDLELLRPRGTVVIIGCRGFAKINPRRMMKPETSIVGCSLFSSTNEEWKEIGSAVVKAMESGVAKPRIFKTYSLEDVADGHDSIMSGKPTLGNHVVNVS